MQKFVKYWWVCWFYCSILMDLSKAQDCLKDDLLLPKLQAYGLVKKV